jgi:hypothetical protein
MSSTYLLVDSEGELESHSGSVEYLNGILPLLDAGRYALDEVSTDPLPSGHKVRARQI